MGELYIEAELANVKNPASRLLTPAGWHRLVYSCTQCVNLNWKFFPFYKPFLVLFGKSRSRCDGVFDFQQIKSLVMCISYLSKRLPYDESVWANEPKPSQQ
jgi:hypothetical protein